ncbi:MAG TPA: DUF3108 domain-containing protein [Bryobacteraceae bacterium]|nr:DUF3108 domain-containing protein [Bryobacteraceae bacterium]
MARWLVFLVCPPLLWPQGVSLPAKEVLSYNVEWRLVTAGKARLELTSTTGLHGGYQVTTHVESVGLVSKLFKVEDDYRATLNPAMCVQSSELTAHEGIRRRNTRITFDGEAHKASYLERDLAKNAVLNSSEIEIPECVHDVVGGIYFLRTLNLEPGQSIDVPVSDGKKSVMAKIEAQQREDLKIAGEAYKTIRYEIYLFDGVLYRRSAHLNVWLTDDRRRLPVQIRVRMQFTIGTITLHLADSD